MSPGDLGLDSYDPRLVRNMDMALRVYCAAVGRRQSRERSKWEGSHPTERKLLAWAEAGAVHKDSDGVVTVEY